MAVVRQQSARSGRWPELGLTLAAVVLVLFGYVQVELATSGTVPVDLATRGGVIAGLALALHLVVRWRAPYADPVILPVVVLLNGIGLTMIHRLDIAEGTGSVDRQIMWTAVGMGLAVAVLLAVRDHRALRRLTYTSALAGIILLLLPMVPGLGRTINGARIWIGVGSMSFQPAEVAKILLALFFAGYLVDNRDNLALAGPRFLGVHLPRLRDLGPIILAWVVGMAVLVAQRDLGTAVLFFGMFVAVMYLATERVSWVILGGLLAGGGAYLASTIFPHVGARVDVWLNALDPAVYSRNPGGSGQLVQGLFGMASGGLMGTGWGQGYPHLVPYAESDFIMASLGEELGLTGLLAILLLYLVLVQRGLRAAVAVRDGFGKLLAAGLAFTMGLQVFVVVGGVTRLIPLTGLTSPFLALGGSSLVANWMIVALLLRISDSGRRPAAVVDPGAVIALGSTTAPSPDDAATAREVGPPELVLATGAPVPPAVPYAAGTDGPSTAATGGPRAPGVGSAFRPTRPASGQETPLRPPTGPDRASTSPDSPSPGSTAPVPPGSSAPVPPGSSSPVPPGSSSPVPPGSSSPASPGSTSPVRPAGVRPTEQAARDAEDAVGTTADLAGPDATDDLSATWTDDDPGATWLEEER